MVAVVALVSCTGTGEDGITSSVPTSAPLVSGGPAGRMESTERAVSAEPGTSSGPQEPYTEVRPEGTSSVLVRLPLGMSRQPEQISVIDTPALDFEGFAVISPTVEITGADGGTDPVEIVFDLAPRAEQLYVRHITDSGTQILSPTTATDGKVVVLAADFSSYDIVYETIEALVERTDVEPCKFDLTPLRAQAKDSAERILDVCAHASSESGVAVIAIENDTATDLTLTLPNLNITDVRHPGAGDFLGLLRTLAFGVAGTAVIPAGEVVLLEVDVDEQATTAAGRSNVGVEAHANWETMKWALNGLGFMAGKGVFRKADGRIREVLEDIPDEIGTFFAQSVNNSRSTTTADLLRTIAARLDELDHDTEQRTGMEDPVLQALYDAFTTGADCLVELEEKGWSTQRVLLCITAITTDYVGAAIKGLFEDGPVGAAWELLDGAVDGALGVATGTANAARSIALNPPGGDGRYTIQFGLAVALVDVSGAFVSRAVSDAHHYALTGKQRDACVFEGNNYTGVRLPKFHAGNPCEVFGEDTSPEAREARAMLARLLETPPRRFVCQWWDDLGRHVQRDGWVYGSRTIPELGPYAPDWRAFASGRVRVGGREIDLYTDEEREVAQKRVTQASEWQACVTDDGIVRELLERNESAAPRPVEASRPKGAYRSLDEAAAAWTRYLESGDATGIDDEYAAAIPPNTALDASAGGPGWLPLLCEPGSTTCQTLGVGLGVSLEVSLTQACGTLWVAEWVAVHPEGEEGPGYDVALVGDPVLQSGMVGEDVRRLQLMLGSLGLLSDEVDGMFGPNTVTAVRAFQQAHGLPADGLVGPNTATALEEVTPDPEKVYATADC